MHWTCVFLALCVGWFSSVRSESPPAEQRIWSLSKGGRQLTREQVSGSVSDGKWTLSSRAELRLGGASTTLEQETLLDAEKLSFLSYRLVASSPGNVQTISAWPIDGGVKFRIETAGGEIEEEGSGPPPILCLDNLLLGQYEVLGRMALRSDGPFEFTLAVPQVMKTFKASFDPGPLVSIRLDDRVLAARHGKLSVANVLTEVWYDAANGSPYRMRVVAQKIDARVDGWQEVVEPAPASDDDEGPAPSPQSRLK